MKLFIEIVNDRLLYTHSTRVEGVEVEKITYLFIYLKKKKLKLKLIYFKVNINVHIMIRNIKFHGNMILIKNQFILFFIKS